MSKSGLSPHIRYLIEDMRAERRDLDARIEAFDAEVGRQDDACRRLCVIGALNATTLSRAVGNHVRSCGVDGWARSPGHFGAPTGDPAFGMGSPTAPTSSCGQPKRGGSRRATSPVHEPIPSLPSPTPND